MSALAARDAWTRVRFTSVVTNVSDRVDDPSKAGVDRYVGLEHIDPGSMTITRWGTPDQVEAQKLRFLPGDVIFGRRRAYQKKVARADFEGICSAHALVLRAKPGLIDPDFLPVFLSSDAFLDRAVEISVGSLSPTVNWGTLAQEEFDLPPIDEQRRMAGFLWAIEAERTATRTLLEATRDAEDALLEEIARTPANARPLGTLVSLQQGRPVPSTLYTDSGMRLLRAGDLKPRGLVRWTADSVFLPDSYASGLLAMHLSPGDLVINMTAQTLDEAFLGRVCRISSPCLLNQRIGRFIPRERVDTDHLFAVLRSKAFTDFVAGRAEGSKIKHMHWRHIEDFPVPVPDPDVRAQQLMQLAKVEYSFDAVTARLQSVESLRSAVMREIFGGEE